MAKIEDEFIRARGVPAAQTIAPPFLPRKPIPQIGFQRIDGERFFSREFMDREWEHIWTRTWHVGVHVTELPDPGSFRVHELGRESLLFVRGEDGRIRFQYTNPDYTVRLHPRVLLAAARVDRAEADGRLRAARAR